jgi:hypothetical protein
MQTFLPYSDFSLSAAVLDRQRLGKQRVEGMQLLKTLTSNGGWSNHPAAKMWKGHEASLANYTLAVIEQWKSRGYKDTCDGKVREICSLNGINLDTASFPDWLGDRDFHISHRSNLIRKKPDYYSHMWPDVPNDLPYIWPA